MNTEAGMCFGAGYGADAASDASRRLERSRRAALSRSLAERRHALAAQVAVSLAELLSDSAAEAPDVGVRA